MLQKLVLEDYGLVKSAEISFADGATMFTGETGSGKTMILGAIAFALGERASADVVRRGAARARVTLTFQPGEALYQRLLDDGFECDPGEEAAIVREMNENGKSSVRVNGRVATASFVREFSETLAEIVGQHEAQRLLLPAYQIELLDRFARAGFEREEVAAAYDRWVHEREALAALAGNERRVQEQLDDAQFAVAEIEALALTFGEDERLSERRRYLENVERIAASLRTSHEALASDEGGATAALGSAAAALGSIADMSADLAEMAGQASALQSEATELATRISRELDATEFDAAELDAINARLDAIDKLKRKYGASIDAVLAHAEEARQIIARVESRDEHREALTDAVEKAKAELDACAKLLTEKRTVGSRELAKAVSGEFADLALASGRFEVVLVPLDEAGRDGAESVDFRFAANAGEPLRPLSRTASGGELSRMLLALIVALASARERNALIFDEIDAGIGGATATAVGVRLGRLARDGQIVCVTHLAQLATWAQRHYVLEKRETDGHTTISLREIHGDDERAAELARMLSGESHDVALEHARTLLKAAR